jgi:polysaccharide export outer membrane protein
MLLAPAVVAVAQNSNAAIPAIVSKRPAAPPGSAGTFEGKGNTVSPDSGRIDDKINQAVPVTMAQNPAPQQEPQTGDGQAIASQNSGPVATGGSASTPGTPQLSQRDARYRLNPSDVLAITFPFTPEYNENVTVQPDGFINLRQLPDMKVQGLTTPEVTAAITNAYTKLLHDPMVTVTLQNFLNPYFIAYGEVNTPGKFQLYGPTTVAQAIGIAGGYTYKAKHSDVYLFRRVNDQWVSAQKVDLKHMLYNGNLAEDQALQSGDMIWVPKNGVSKLISIQPLMPWNYFQVNYVPRF